MRPKPGTTDVTSTSMEGIVQQIRSFCDQSVSSIKASVSETMAEFSLLYFPLPPRQITSLPIISEIEVHPSRLAAFRLFMGNPHAQWSCLEQAVFVEHIVGGRNNVLGISTRNWIWEDDHNHVHRENLFSRQNYGRHHAFGCLARGLS